MTLRKLGLGLAALGFYFACLMLFRPGVNAQYAPPSGGGGGGGTWGSITGTLANQTDLQAALSVPGAPYFTIGSTSYGPVFAVGVPPASGWSWMNQGGSTATAVNGSIQLSMPRTGSNTMRAYVRNLPASTGYTLIIGQLTASQAVGACISDGTKLIAIWQQTSGTISAFKFSDTATIGSNYFGDNAVLPARVGIWWLRIQDAGGNRTVSVSADGQMWNVLDSQVSATFLTETTGGPCYETNTNLPATSTVIDVRLTTP